MGFGSDTLRAGRQESEQIVSERIELRQQHPVGTGEGVVSQYRRDGHGEPGTGHDQGLPYWTRDLIEAPLPAHADFHQSVVNTPDRTEQTNEGRSTADRRE